MSRTNRTAESVAMGDELHDAGVRVRRDVLGDEHVDAALNACTDFDQPMQDLLHSFAWGAVWTRPGLDRRTRSLLSLVLLIALNRPEELRLHVAGALRNGATPEEISEAFLHAAVYCGMPAAISSFRIARPI